VQKSSKVLCRCINTNIYKERKKEIKEIINKTGTNLRGAAQPAAIEVLTSGTPRGGKNHPIHKRLNAGKTVLHLCPECECLYPPKKKKQIYCGDKCYKASRKPDGRVCLNPNCPLPGRLFTPAESDQQTCSKSCSAFVRCNPEPPIQRATPELLVQWEAESVRYCWTKVQQGQWSMKEFWFWGCHVLAEAGHPPEYNIERKGWGQLRHLHSELLRGDGSKGVPIVVLVEVFTRMVAHFTRISGKFKWQVPFTPGALLAYWNHIEAKIEGGHGHFLTVSRGDAKPDGAYKPVSDGKSFQEDYSPITAEVKIPEEAYIPITGVDKNVPKGDKDVAKKIAITEWKLLAPEKWSVTTIWAMLSTCLGELEVPIHKLNYRGRQQFKGLLEEQDMDTVISVSKAVADHYLAFEGHFRWFRPFRPGAFIAFFAALKKLVQKKYPHYFSADNKKEDYHALRGD